jgi:hypothetical protein
MHPSIIERKKNPVCEKQKRKKKSPSARTVEKETRFVEKTQRKRKIPRIVVPLKKSHHQRQLKRSNPSQRTRLD